MITSRRIPKEYRQPSARAGKIEELVYTAVIDGKEYQKHALVYLPFGYDTSPERRYPVFTLMHGGGGSHRDFLAGSDPLPYVLDHLIEEEILAPLIVVTPSYYHEGTENAFHDIGKCVLLTEIFHEEYRNALIPAIDRNYRTIPSREGRAFGGFSMGSEATWSTLAFAADCAKYYLPMSGDWWFLTTKGGESRTEDTCKAFLEQFGNCGVRPEDCFIFAATGTNDIAYPAMDPMVHRLMDMSGGFDKNSLVYCLSDGFHSGEYCLDYMAQGLPMFYPGKNA